MAFEHVLWGKFTFYKLIWTKYYAYMQKRCGGDKSKARCTFSDGHVLISPSFGMALARHSSMTFPSLANKSRLQGLLSSKRQGRRNTNLVKVFGAAWLLICSSTPGELHRVALKRAGGVEVLGCRIPGEDYTAHVS